MNKSPNRDCFEKKYDPLDHQVGSNYNADSLTNVYSSTKSITAIVMAIAQDRGWFKESMNRNFIILFVVDAYQFDSYQ